MMKKGSYRRYGLNMREAKILQKFTIEMSGTKKYLDKLLELKEGKSKPGLYVSYEIDESELEDDGLDYCTPVIARVFSVNEKGEKTEIATLSAYNGETYWLEINEDTQVDTAENWWELILEEYDKLKQNDGNN